MNEKVTDFRTAKPIRFYRKFVITGKEKQTKISNAMLCIVYCPFRIQLPVRTEKSVQMFYILRLLFFSLW
jgi:hypothetical protein